MYKTPNMLRAAHAAQEQGHSIVVGYVEPHPRPETAALLPGLEAVPPLRIEHRGITLNELDVDAVLARKPEIALVDELAHSNTQGCRNLKRFQDVEELLQAGISVWTTVNVQHLESLNDVVAAMESTYGDRDHKDESLSVDELGEAIAYSYGKGEKVIIPAFAVERTQEVLYCLHMLPAGTERRLKLVYPGKSGASEDSISILAPVGSALLGLAEGDDIHWPNPNGGTLHLVVHEVEDQPERAGHYDL